MGRFTPVTISTRGDRKGRLTLVGVPPNMSVRISTSPPPTSAIARSMASRAAVHVVGPADGHGGDGRDVAHDGAGGVHELPGQLRRGVTTTMPIMPVTPGAGRDGARAPDSPCRASFSAERVRDHHRAVAAAGAADRRW